MTRNLSVFIVFLAVSKVYTECGERGIGYSTTGHTLYDNDSTTVLGNLFLLPIDVWNISCCGVISAWEFIPLNTGVIYFQIWRPVNSSFQYELKASTSFTVKESDKGRLVNLTLASGQRITVLNGDRIGWYSSGRSALSYQRCSEENCQESTRTLNTTVAPSTGDILDWDDDDVFMIDNRSYILKVYTKSNSAPYMNQDKGVITVQENVPIGTSVTPIDVKDDDLDDELKFSLSNVLFSINTTIKNSICIQTQALLNETAEQEINLTVNAWDSCMNNLTVTFRVSIVPPEMINESSTLPYISTTSLSEEVMNEDDHRKRGDNDELVLGLTMSFLILGSIIGIIVYRCNYIRSKARPSGHSANSERADIYTIPDNISLDEGDLDIEEYNSNHTGRIFIRISDVNYNSKNQTTVL